MKVAVPIQHHERGLGGEMQAKEDANLLDEEANIAKDFVKRLPVPVLQYG
jgi:hypothetical protein